MRSNVDDEEVVPFHIAQQKSVDPYIDQPSHKIYNVAVVAEPDNRLRFVDRPPVLIKQINSNNDIGCNHNPESNYTRNGQLRAVETVGE